MSSSARMASSIGVTGSKRCRNSTSMRSVCRRRRLASTACTKWRRGEPRAVTSGAGGFEAFGGQHEIVAVVLRQPAEDLLRLALVVLVGAAEEIDARVAHRLVERRGRRFIGIAAEGHGAETEFGDGDAGTAEELVFHRRIAAHNGSAGEPA